MSKVALNIKNLPDAPALVKAQTAATACAGTALADPTPPEVTALAAACTALETAMADRATKEQEFRAAVVVQDQKRAALEVAYSSLGSKVQTISEGDAAFINAHGFDVVGAKTPVGPLPAPAGLEATMSDQPGQVDLMWEPVRGAKTYIVQKCADPMTEGNWQQVDLCTKSKFTVTGLVSGTKYWFRVAAKGAEPGNSPWSDPAQKMAP
jgi:hypothetical protein